MKVIPKYMKAILGLRYGPVHSNNLELAPDPVESPRLEDLSPEQRKTSVLIRVLTVALAPGDVRAISGLTRELQGPPSLPYIPGGDACGVVQAVGDEGDPPFQVGDRIAYRFQHFPRGMLGDYAIVSTITSAKVPDELSDVDAAVLAGASPALELAEKVRKNDRVLVLGAGGGIGTHICQMLRERASEVVGVASDGKRLLAKPIQCDDAIDYTNEDPLTSERYLDRPFDTVIDLASGGYWPKLCATVQGGVKSIIKSASQGGRYLTISMDEPWYEIHSEWQAMRKFMFLGLYRYLASRLWLRWKVPAFSFFICIPQSNEYVDRSLQMASQGRLKAVVHGGKPFPMTTEGTRKAFGLV